MSYKILIILIGSFILLEFGQCKKTDPQAVSYTIEQNSSVAIASGISCSGAGSTSILLQLANNNFGVSTGTFSCGSGAQVQMSDVGKVKSILKIKEYPSGGWASAMSAVQGHGYVIRFKDASGNYSYAKMFVEDFISYSYAKVQIRYPF